MDRTVRRLGSGIPEPFRDFLFGNNSCCFRDGTTLVFRYTFRPLLRFLLSDQRAGHSPGSKHTRVPKANRFQPPCARRVYDS